MEILILDFSYNKPIKDIGFLGAGIRNMKNLKELKIDLSNSLSQRMKRSDFIDFFDMFDDKPDLKVFHLKISGDYHNNFY